MSWGLFHVAFQPEWIAWNAYEAPVRIFVHLPPGSTRQVLFIRDSMRHMARTSSVGFDLLLNFFHDWNEWGTFNNGRGRVATFRRKALRNAQGWLIRIEDGIERPVLLKQQPTRHTRNNGRPVRGVVYLDDNDNEVPEEFAAYELNPAALKKYRALTQQDLLERAYPQRLLLESPASKKRSWARVIRKALKMLEDNGYLYIREGDKNIFGSKTQHILPPTNWYPQPHD